MNKSTPMHFGGFGRRPEPTGNALIARNMNLSAHTQVRSRGDIVRAALARATSDMDALGEGDVAHFAMAAPGDLIEKSIEALSALGADFEPGELSMALLPALSALGRAVAQSADDDAAAQGTQGTTPRERRERGPEIERRVDADLADLTRKCIPEGFAGVVVSHVRAR